MMKINQRNWIGEGGDCFSQWKEEDDNEMKLGFLAELFLYWAWVSLLDYINIGLWLIKLKLLFSHHILVTPNYTFENTPNTT